MGEPREPGLELRRRQEDPAIEHRAEERGERGPVAGQRLGGVERRAALPVEVGAGRPEEDRQQGPRPSDRDRPSGRLRPPGKPGDQPIHARLEGRISLGPQLAQGRDTGRHREGVPGQRAGLVHRPVGRDE